MYSREVCIADGRVHFTVPKLFKASMCLLGAHHEDGWFFVDVEFLFNIGGDTTGMQSTYGLPCLAPRLLSPSIPRLPEPPAGRLSAPHRGRG